MRFHTIHHIGIAVADFDAAVARYTRLHGAPPVRITDVPGEGVQVAFFPVGPTQIELLAATDPQSPIARSIAKRGPGLHHICYAVANLDTAVADLRTAGFTPIVRPTTEGATGERIVFFHPKDTDGVLIELMEAKKN